MPDFEIRYLSDRCLALQIDPNRQGSRIAYFHPRTFRAEAIPHQGHNETHTLAP